MLTHPIIAEIIAVGSEMLTPFRQDTNSLFLTEQLNTLGIPVAFKTIVGDALPHLTGAIRTALSRADLVLISGGLGPTEDDLTREALAEVLHLPLRRDSSLLQGLRERFAARNLPMPPNNSKQADVLAGAEILPNRNGSAAGQYLNTEVDGLSRIAILLPGPPRELKALFTTECLPRLQTAVPPAHLARRVLRMAVIPESLVDSQTAPVYTTYPDVETTILAGGGEIQLHFTCSKATRDEAAARVRELSTRIEVIMGDGIFSAGEDTATSHSLPETVLAQLATRNLTFAAAESCTGGMLLERLTAVPGSSTVVLGGAVTYSNALKSSALDVPAGLIDREGAVSEPVARRMAEGVRARTGASVALSITGIAGPATPNSTKPVGLVYIALADAHTTLCWERRLSGDREHVRFFATQHALDLLRRHLLNDELRL